MKSKIGTFVIVWILGFNLAAIAGSPEENSKTQQVDALFAHLGDGVKPGAAVLVVQDGEAVYSKGFGYADIERKIPMTPEMTFRLASVSKQFTAAAILVLAEQGKLDIDDPLVDYLPTMSMYPGVTIRHLLNHTSGMPDYYDEIAEEGELLTNEDVEVLLATKTEADFSAGEKYAYSNSAYELLAQVVETVSGQPFAEFMGESVFEPAGMTGALIHDHNEPEIQNRVYGYDSVRDGYVLNDASRLNGIVGSGGMYATLDDFYAWDTALNENAVMSADSLAEAYTHASLNSGEEIDYGLGWGLGEYSGYRRAEHGGSWVGFRTGIVRFLDAGLSVVVLTNNSSYEPEMLAERISDIYLPSSTSEYRSAASFERVQRQQRRLPDDEIWWTVNGTDMAWNNKNLHQIFPTVNVYRGGTISELESSPMEVIANYGVETPQGTMTFDDFIHSDQSTTLGIVILHQGKIVFERYPRMQEYEMPVFWSVAKTFVGTVVRILEERGQINVDDPIEYYIPELEASDFAGISVRDILDMATGLDCADEYEDKESCYYQYSMAIGDGFRLPGAADNPYDFAATLKASKHAEPGEKFSYSGLNTFVLAWLVEKATGVPFQDAFSREVWYHIGAESNASYIAPRYGIAVAHGGFMARLRDVARFGLLFTPSSTVVTDKDIISDEHVDFLWTGGRPELFTNIGVPPTEISGIKHNIYQWDQIRSNGDYYKGGWAGQGLLVNPQRDVVAVFNGYFKDDAYSEVRLEPVLMRLLDDVFGDSGQTTH